VSAANAESQRSANRSVVEGGVIVVFAKEPHAGQVKTRMCPPLSPSQAAAFYGCLLDDILVATSHFSVELGLSAVLAVHPPSACQALARRAPPVFRVIPQRGTSLAERMESGAAQAGAEGARRILLRGSDSPCLGLDVMRAALQALETKDLAISPDEDGGYSLIGMRRPVAGLFHHAMSTHTVFEDTIANAEAFALKTHRLPASFDLDTIGDLRFLAKARQDGDARWCQRSLAWLDEHRIWEFALD
jgi:rSAM/selenodomain-associated transferase 1